MSHKPIQKVEKQLIGHKKAKITLVMSVSLCTTKTPIVYPRSNTLYMRVNYFISKVKISISSGR